MTYLHRAACSSFIPSRTGDFYFETIFYIVALSSNVFGNITRLDNALEGMGPKLQACRELLSKFTETVTI